MKITYLGHATLAVEMNNKKILYKNFTAALVVENYHRTI